jgi:hypothetical protein
MPFAAVTTVKLDDRDPAEAQKLLSEVLVPMIKAQPGFQSARFLRSQDGKTGVGAVVFDTESNARLCLDRMATERPPEAPQVESTATYEIVLEV